MSVNIIKVVDSLNQYCIDCPESDIFCNSKVILEATEALEALEAFEIFVMKVQYKSM